MIVRNVCLTLPRAETTRPSRETTCRRAWPIGRQAWGTLPSVEIDARCEKMIVRDDCLALPPAHMIGRRGETIAPVERRIVHSVVDDASQR
jgi:hypothetical protein